VQEPTKQTKYILLTKLGDNFWTAYNILYDTVEEATLVVAGNKMTNNNWTAYRIVKVEDLPMDIRPSV
jgi:hypothetical protein